MSRFFPRERFPVPREACQFPIPTELGIVVPNCVWFHQHDVFAETDVLVLQVAKLGLDQLMYFADETHLWTCYRNGIACHGDHIESHVICPIQSDQSHLCPYQPTLTGSRLLCQSIEVVLDDTTVHAWPISISVCSWIQRFSSAEQPLSVYHLQWSTAIRCQLYTFDPSNIVLLRMVTSERCTECACINFVVILFTPIQVGHDV